MRRPVLLVMVLLLSAGWAGCLEPFRPHVDPDALQRITPSWTEEVLPGRSDGWLGPNTIETKYRHESGDDPPFPGVLQVFGIRQFNGRSTSELLAWTRDIVDQAVERENIRLDGNRSLEGERELASGLRTKWFVVEGRVQGEGQLFEQDVIVRILGEVGRDGASNTGFVAVGFVQVERSVRNPVCSPILPTCEDRLQRQRDLRTWTSLAGDPQGSIGGATAENALLWDLVTHG